MAVDVVSSIEMGRRRAEVAGFAADLDNASLWCANIRPVAWIPQPPLEVGSRVAFVASFIGRRTTYTHQVRAHVLASKLVMKRQEGPFPDGDVLLLGVHGPRNEDDAASPPRLADASRATARALPASVTSTATTSPATRSPCA